MKIKDFKVVEGENITVEFDMETGRLLLRGNSDSVTVEQLEEAFRIVKMVCLTTGFDKIKPKAYSEMLDYDDEKPNDYNEKEG